MKIYGERVKSIVVGICCDRCSKIYDNTYEIQEFLSWKMTCGYCNYTYGDMTRIEIDLCQRCTKEALGQWMRVIHPLSKEELMRALKD